MAIEHTPGPWKRNKRFDGRIEIVREDGVTLAWMNAYAETEADASMMRAAPDLLAALESIRDGYQQLWDVMPVAWQGFDNIAEQAIEKARDA